MSSATTLSKVRSRLRDVAKSDSLVHWLGDNGTVLQRDNSFTRIRSGDYLFTFHYGASDNVGFNTRLKGRLVGHDYSLSKDKPVLLRRARQEDGLRLHLSPKKRSGLVGGWTPPLDEPEFLDFVLGQSLRLCQRKVLRPGALSDTETTAVTKVRRGQGAYRNAVIKNFGGRCAVTGCEVREVLDAAHLVGWADDVSLRRDPTNGVLLRTDLHLLFDSGLLSFELTDAAVLCILSPAGRSAYPDIHRRRLSLPSVDAISLRRWRALIRRRISER